jgi:predicted metalloprotease
MRWTRGGSRKNLEDRRGQSPVGIGGLGGMSVGRMGLGGMVLLLVLSLVFGQDLLTGGGGGGVALNPPPGGAAGGPVTESAEEAELVEFVNFVLNDNQEVWATVLPRYGEQYRDARLVIFRGAVQSRCGNASSAMGPFYCPLDERVYIDLGFYDELHSQFGATGDFAQAYVLAHEIGHHLQHVLGINGRVRQLQEANPGQTNQLSVRLELQADCYAGVWANSTQQRRLLEAGDLEEALRAASAIGDDRIQQQMTGEVRPESFTHGTAQQRSGWFHRGFETGSPEACDTFNNPI